jgi:hypothetical protein
MESKMASASGFFSVPKKKKQVDVTTEARIMHAPEIKAQVGTTRERRKGVGLQCKCGALMLVERTRRPGAAYPHWVRKPYRVWGCPKCGKKVRQRI